MTTRRLKSGASVTDLDVWNAAAIAKRYGVKTNTVYFWIRRYPDFPTPLVIAEHGPNGLWPTRYWEARKIERWHAKRWPDGR